MGLLNDGTSVLTVKASGEVAPPPSPDEGETPGGVEVTQESDELGTVEEVLAAVDAGSLDAEEALEAERAGKARVTLIEALEDRVTAPGQ